MSYDKIKEILTNNKCNFIYINSTASTMGDAKLYLEKSKSNIVVIANKQTKGRGRRGNKWISPSGNIYCSIALNNTIPINEYFLFSILTLISIQNTLESLGVREILFKWPNDIFFENKKFGGIILEPYSLNKDNKYVIIGLGINFLSSPLTCMYQTTYLRKFLQIKNKSIFFDLFFNNFFFNWNNYTKEKNNIVSKFKNSLMYLNQKIEIQTNSTNKIVGIFKGINNDGSLILDKGNEIVSIYSGSIKT